MDQSHSFWAWSERLMTTTTTDTCLVHQTEAQRNHCAVGNSEMCPTRSDLQCSDYHVFNEIMINVPLWTKMFAQMRMTWILSDVFKYMTAGLSGCRDLLLSKKPCTVAESKVNAGWKLDGVNWPPWHGWDLKAWCGGDRSFHPSGAVALPQEPQPVIP